jgi:hypothetical protein
MRFSFWRKTGWVWSVTALAIIAGANRASAALDATIDNAGFETHDGAYFNNEVIDWEEHDGSSVGAIVWSYQGIIDLPAAPGFGVLPLNGTGDGFLGFIGGTGAGTRNWVHQSLGVVAPEDVGVELRFDARGSTRTDNASAADLIISFRTNTTGGASGTLGSLMGTPGVTSISRNSQTTFASVDTARYTPTADDVGKEIFAVMSSHHTRPVGDNQYFMDDAAISTGAPQGLRTTLVNNPGFEINGGTTVLFTPGVNGWSEHDGYANGAGVWNYAANPGLIGTFFPANISGNGALSLITKEATPTSWIVQSIGQVSPDDVGATFTLDARAGARIAEGDAEVTIAFRTGAAGDDGGSAVLGDVIGTSGTKLLATDLSAPVPLSAIDAAVFIPTAADVGKNIYVTIAAAGLTFSADGDENQYMVDDVSLAYSPVPEPASASLAALFAMAAACWGRRRRRK